MEIESNKADNSTKPLIAEQFCQRWLKIFDLIHDIEVQKQVVKNFIEDIKCGNHENLTKNHIILQIIEQFDKQHMVEFFKGAHFTVEDNGKLYHALAEIGYHRFSSHYLWDKPKPDIGIKAGSLFSQLLVGVTSNGTSWFQIEKSPMPKLSSNLLKDTNELKNLLCHTLDMVSYLTCKYCPLLTPVNIGQYGKSKHIDNIPIKLNSELQISAFNYQVTPENYILDSLGSINYLE
jgi:hypothetical protein